LQESQPKIIVIGSVESAMERLSQKLNGAGFTEVKRQPIANIAIRKNDAAQIAIFLPKVAAESRNSAAYRLRKVNPALKIVMLYEHNISGTEVADAVINANCETEDLARVISYLTRKSPQEASRRA
jgi:hypothetical protein